MRTPAHLDEGLLAPSNHAMKTLLISLALCIPLAPFAQAQEGSLSNAEALYQAGDYARAAESYRDTMEATDDPGLRLRCLLRLGDCAYLGGPFEDKSEDAYPDAFYAQVLDHGYSPYLAEAYRKWLATTQMYWHGVSNFSEIPTAKYHARKQQVLRVIGAHLKGYPDDPAALAQQAFLRQLPDIQRGGPMGSSVLNEMAMLWPEAMRRTSTKEDDPELQALSQAVLEVESSWSKSTIDPTEK